MVSHKTVSLKFLTRESIYLPHKESVYDTTSDNLRKKTYKGIIFLF